MLITGFTALLVQIIYLREFLNVFSSNELIVGIIQGAWMLLTAGGARLVGMKGIRNRTVSGIAVFQIFISLIIPASVFAIYWAKAHFYPPGTLPAFYGSALFCFLIMAPFCTVSGGLFSLLSNEFSKMTGRQQAQNVYGLEAIGSFAGGLLFTFLLIQYLSTFQIIFVVSAVNVFAAFLLMSRLIFSRVTRLIMLVFISVLLMAPFIVDFDALSKSYVFKGQKIVLMEDNPYGNLVVTQTGGQFNFFENGISLFSTDDLIANEEVVHYAMIQHKNPKSVLLVSGDAAGMMAEISKYDINEIDYVEINPHLIAAMEKFVRPPDEKIHIHVCDARKYIVETKTKYDVVLLNLPPPANLAFNRFFTDAFFAQVKQILNPGGVISIPMEGGSNYLSDEALKLMSILNNTLRSHFNNVMVYLGENNFFLASDDSLSYEIAGRLALKNIENEFVNSYYIHDELAESRALSIQEALDPRAAINKDFRPLAYYSQISYWLSWYGQKMWWVLELVVIGLLSIFVFSRPFNKSLLVTGFSAAVIEVVILLAFQICFGQLYQSLALLIAGFMVGLAAGVRFAERKASKIKLGWFIKTQGMIGLLSLVVFLLVVSLNDFSFPDFALKTIFFLSMLIFGSITGMQFSFAMELLKRRGVSDASSAYAADLLGAAGGAILASVLLIPVLGLPGSAFLLFGLNLLMVIILYISKSRKVGS